jgi:two-component system cell cycle sensor histidine kinase/response regulator CckA
MAAFSSPTSRPLIVVVDDAPSARVIVSRALTEAGYDVLTAPDGLSAVALIQGLHILPNLVITDLHMPNMRGEQLAYWLHQHFPQVPVLFMSAFECEGGADLRGYLIPKPFMPGELCAAVDQILGLNSGKERALDHAPTSFLATRQV